MTAIALAPVPVGSVMMTVGTVLYPEPTLEAKIEAIPEFAVLLPKVAVA
jgi:hypothetical protein